MTVRQGVPSDLTAVAALWEAFLAEQAALDAALVPAADAPARIRRTLADLLRGEGGVVFVAESAAVVAFLVAEFREAAPLWSAAEEVHFGELYVAPEARRQGVGRALLGAGATWAQREGVPRVTMDVLGANAASRAMVEAWGGRLFSVAYHKDLGEAP